MSSSNLENGDIESFIGKLRDELLARELLLSLRNTADPLTLMLPLSLRRAQVIVEIDYDSNGLSIR